MDVWKKFLLILIGALVIVVPTAILFTIMVRDSSHQRLTIAFIERYGAEVKLVEIIKPESMYIYVWDDEKEGSTIRHYTLSIDGLFVELGQVEIKEQ